MGLILFAVAIVAHLVAAPVSFVLGKFRLTKTWLVVMILAYMGGFQFVYYASYGLRPREGWAPFFTAESLSAFLGMLLLQAGFYSLGYSRPMKPNGTVTQKLSKVATPRWRP